MPNEEDRFVLPSARAESPVEAAFRQRMEAERAKLALLQRVLDRLRSIDTRLQEILEAAQGGER